MEGDQTRQKLLIFSFSTVAAITVSSFIKITIPRKIGPAEFGTFCTFENLSISIFAFTTFGLEHITRSKKLVSDNEVRQIHSEATSFRLLICIIILFGSFYFPNENSLTLSLLLLWQLFFTQNTIYCSILQRYEKITANAATSILSKLLFLIFFIALQSDINSSYSFALFTTSFEIVRTIIIVYTIRKYRLPVSIIPSLPRKKTLLTLYPFFFQHITQQLYAKINGIIIPLISNRSETGYYGAANNIILLGVVFTPAINAVLAPLLSRTESNKQRNDISERSTLFILPLLIFFSVAVFTFSLPICTSVFGADFKSASLALKSLSPTIPITYISIIFSIDAINNRKISSLAKINLSSLVTTTIISTLLIHLFLATYRPGLCSFGASISILLCESIAAFRITKNSTLILTQKSRQSIFTTLSASTFLIGTISTLK